MKGDKGYREEVTEWNRKGGYHILHPLVLVSLNYQSNRIYALEVEKKVNKVTSINLNLPKISHQTRLV